MGKRADRLIGLGLEPLKSAEVENNSVASPYLDSVSAAVTAAGTILSNATALTSIINNVSTTAASTGVSLPSVAIGVTIGVKNSGANTLNVFPYSASETINGGSAGAAVTLATTVGAEFKKITSTGWITL